MLGFFELPPDDQPPQEIWHSSDRLKAWFEAVKQKREDRAKGLEPIEDVPVDDMQENEAASALKKEMGLT